MMVTIPPGNCLPELKSNNVSDRCSTIEGSDTYYIALPRYIAQSRFHSTPLILEGTKGYSKNDIFKIKYVKTAILE